METCTHIFKWVITHNSFHFSFQHTDYVTFFIATKYVRHTTSAKKKKKRKEKEKQSYRGWGWGRGENRWRKFSSVCRLAKLSMVSLLSVHSCVLVCVSVCFCSVPVCIPVCHFAVYLPVLQSVYLSLCARLCVWQSVFLSVSQCVCLFCWWNSTIRQDMGQTRRQT